MGRGTLAGLVIVVLVPVCLAGTAPVRYRNTEPGIAYVGSQACAGCHRSISESYFSTGMGRSMSAVSGAGQLQLALRPASVVQAAWKRRFDVSREDNSLFQTESEPGVFENKH